MIKNPIINELIKLKLINKSDLNIISESTRDKKIRVIKDKKSKIIFLEKFASNNNYYKYLRYNDNDRKNIDKVKKITKVKTLTGIVKTPIIDDDLRRFNQFKNILGNGEYIHEIELRNDPNLRKLFADTLIFFISLLIFGSLIFL